MLIYVVDGADACLDGAGVDENKQHAMKIYAVRHMLTMQANSGKKGTITSQHAPSGASQSFNAWKGAGVNATPYGNLLKQIDSTGCIVGLLENTQQMALCLLVVVANEQHGRMDIYQRFNDLEAQKNKYNETFFCALYDHGGEAGKKAENCRPIELVASSCQQAHIILSLLMDRH